MIIMVSTGGIPAREKSVSGQSVGGGASLNASDAPGGTARESIFTIRKESTQ